MIHQKIFLDLFPTSKLLRARVNHPHVTPIATNNPAANEADPAATTVAVKTTEQTMVSSANLRLNAKGKAFHEEVADSARATEEEAATRANDKTVMRDNEAVVDNPYRISSPLRTFMITRRRC